MNSFIARLFSRRRPAILLGAVLGLLLLARLLAGAWLAGHRPEFILHDDGTEYRELAQAVAAGNGLTIRSTRWFEPLEAPRARPEAFRPPLLPVLAAPWLRGAPESLFHLLAFQALLMTALSAAVAGWLWRQAGPAAAGAGVALLNLHPLINVSAARFSTEILFMLCLMLVLLAWQARDRWWSGGAAGAAIGLATLARPTALLLLPAALLLATWPQWRCGVRAVLLAGALVLAGFILTAGPYALRNGQTFGVPTPSGFYGGYICWLGNHPENLASYRAPTAAAFNRHQAAMFADTARELAKLRAQGAVTPLAQQRYWFSRVLPQCQAMGWWDTAALLLHKLWHFVRPWPQPGVYPSAVTGVVAIWNLALAMAGVLGGGLLWKNGRNTAFWPLLALATCGMVAHTLTFVCLRHRYPFLDLTLILAGACWLGHHLPGAALRWRPA